MLITDWWEAFAAFISPPQASLCVLIILKMQRGEKSEGASSEGGWVCVFLQFGGHFPPSFRPASPPLRCHTVLVKRLVCSSGLISHVGLVLFGFWAWVRLRSGLVGCFGPLADKSGLTGRFGVCLISSLLTF